MSPVPPAILRALSLPLDASKSSLSTSGLGSGFASTGRIRARVPREGREDEEEEREYFVKTSPSGQEMFRGEYESLNAIASTVPGFCPRALAHGELDNGRGYFLVTEFLDLSGGRLSSSKTKKANSLAQRLGQLHSTPAPPVTVTEESADGGSSRQVRKPMFGFPVATYCGDTRQPNRFRESWAEFFAEERLLTILAESERRNGRDPALRELVQRTVDSVVPALLRDGHLGGEKGITPVVVHGDLWSGNASTGRIVKPKVGGGGNKDEEDEVGAVVYDPSACYAHNEYELGIMRMFGGFGKAFFDEYHAIVPKTEPVEEYNDRVTLYELYHHLNHHAIFGGGYRSGAVSIMQSLLRKYEKK